jgi:hypothetical protein
MAVFAVLPLRPSPTLEEEIRRHFRDDSLQLPNGDWLISYSGTAVKLSETLQVTDGKSGAAVIVQVSSYYGRAPTNIWDWIKTKLEAKPNV